jgi:hypothetical protein
MEKNLYASNLSMGGPGLTVPDILLFHGKEKGSEITSPGEKLVLPGSKRSFLQSPTYPSCADRTVSLPLDTT